MNQELPDVQPGVKKGRGTRDQISNICWIIGKAREFQKNIHFCFIDYAKPLTVWITINWKILIEFLEIPTTSPACWEIYMQVKKQQSELDMEQWTDFKLGNGLVSNWEKHIKAVYYHPAYLTYMQSTSWETLDWEKHWTGRNTSWNQDCQEKY